jgi:DNA-binding transcriptional LysR family regulator
MRVVVAVGEGGSLSAAARRLGIPLPTVSRRVSDLETRLNTRLFNRSTRRLTLTDAGQAYLHACKRILEDVTEAERAASGEFNAPRGDLVISAPIVFGRLHVLPTITAFLKAYPEVRIRLVQGDRLINLLEEHVDLAIRIGNLPDSSLVATRCGSTRHVVCGSPGYFDEFGSPKQPTDLEAHTLISFEGLSSPDTWVFKAEPAEMEVPVRPKLTLNTAEAAIDAAIDGVGLTRVLSYQVERAMKAGALVTTLKRFEPAPAPISLVYPSQRQLPLKVRAFLDFALPRIRSRLVSPH